MARSWRSARSGVTLIYGILRFSNFAHGDTMAFGAMVTILVTWGSRRHGRCRSGRCPRRFWRCLSASSRPGLLVLGTDRVVYRFYRQQKAKPIIFVIASIGVMFI
jgi:branched-chain amino acid transport system permease protein